MWRPAGSKYASPAGVCISFTSTVAAVAPPAPPGSAAQATHAARRPLAALPLIAIVRIFTHTGRVSNDPSARLRLLHLCLDRGRTDQPLNDVIMRLLDTGMARVVLNIGVVELHARCDR